MGSENERDRFGEPAPEWFREAEVYNGWYQEWTDEVLDTRLAGTPVVAGVPHCKEWIDRAHGRGVRVIPYISFYKSVNVTERREAGARYDASSAERSPFWDDLDLGRHPEWMLYLKDGRVRRPFDSETYPVGWQQVCTNAPGYAEAALRGVRSLMDLGVDGLVIDNVHPCADCFGEELGRHAHVEPEKSNKETYKALLCRVYDLVKSYSRDKVIMLNPGGVSAEYWPYGDAMMYESYICTSAEHSTERWHSPDQLLEMADRCRQALANGKAVIALSYLGSTAFDIKDDAFYCYAWAKLSGFHWADWFTLGESPARELFRIRLGVPVEEREEIDGIYLRRFSKGLVAVNPSEKEVGVRTGWASDVRLRDVYTGETVHTTQGSLSVSVPARSGRVYVRSA